MKHRVSFSRLTEAMLMLLFCYLLIFPQNASEPTRDAIRFCAETLIPSLFIYTVLSKTVISLPMTQRATKRFGVASITLLTGTLCGCPIGAKTAVSLYEKGVVDKKQAEYLCSFTNNASVSFIIGYVGNELFGDVFVGARLLVYQTTASLVTAAIMKRVIYGKERIPKSTGMAVPKTSLREALSDGALTMINITSCAVFFIVVSNAISHTVALSDQGNAMLKSILEFSSGCAESAKLDSFAIPFTAFSLGHCGAAVAMQVKSATDGKLSIKPYIAGKLISCTVMTVLAIIFG